MKSLFKDELIINVYPHSMIKTRWRWCLIESDKYGLMNFGTEFRFRSRIEAEENFKEFAELNNLTNYKFYEEK